MDPGRRLPTVPLMQAYVEDLAAAEWFEARWGARAFDVRPGHGHRKATADEHGVLQMPRWARTELVLLHEVAHCLTPGGRPPHGAEYAGILVCLVRRRMGLGTAQALEDAFLRQRVQWTPVDVPSARPAEVSLPW